MTKELETITPSKSRFLDRTLTVLQRHTVVGALRAWEEITGKARAIKGTIDPDLPRQDKERLLAQMRECLYSKGGEVTARRKTIELGHTYLSLSKKGRTKFLKLLANEFDIDRTQVATSINAYISSDDPFSRIKTEIALRDALESPRVKILRQFSGVPEGLKFLVDMRGDLLELSKQDPALQALETDLCRLLASWFDIGLLDLEEITWQSPASLLEKLIAYEAVHAIRSWADLKNRLDSDRRCFAFFHHKMPEEPLIFVEVALVNGIADNIQVLLDESAPSVPLREADTAIFYSISNTQKGLAGISLGNFLIKRVVDRLLSEFSGLKQFATLSPIPGFTAWLNPLLEKGEESLFAPEEVPLLKSASKEKNPALGLHKLLSNPDWFKDEAVIHAVKTPLTRLCAHYLLKEKKRGKAIDPVANFHLSNGARMERLNWLADTSSKGIKQAAGFMVNYRYQLSEIDDNHETYSLGETIPASKGMKGLVKL